MSVILSSIDRGFMTLLEKPTFWFRLVRVGVRGQSCLDLGRLSDCLAVLFSEFFDLRES